MILSVIFDRFFLGTCLSFGRCLDAIMLHLLGDALMMCGFNSDVGVDDQFSTHGIVDGFVIVWIHDLTMHHMSH